MNCQINPSSWVRTSPPGEMLSNDRIQSKMYFLSNLEVFVAKCFITDRWEWEAVSDLQTGVRDQSKQRSLSDPEVGKIDFVTMLHKFHDNLFMFVTNMSFNLNL